MTLPDLRTTTPVTVMRRVSPVVVIAAVVALAFIGAATLVATLFAPRGHDATVVTAFVLSTLAPTIVGLLALVRGDHAVQVGETNATRLVATAAKVEQVAQDVNGHLGRHDALAASVAQVAETVAAAAGVQVSVPRDPQTRTRDTDVPASSTTDAAPAVADVAPLADQT